MPPMRVGLGEKVVLRGEGLSGEQARLDSQVAPFTYSPFEYSMLPGSLTNVGVKGFIAIGEKDLGFFKPLEVGKSGEITRFAEKSPQSFSPRIEKGGTEVDPVGSFSGDLHSFWLGEKGGVWGLIQFFVRSIHSVSQHRGPEIPTGFVSFPVNRTIQK